MNRDRRYSSYSEPMTAWQVLLAAGIGVSIGLVVHKYTEPPSSTVAQKQTPVEQIQQAGRDLTASAQNIKIGPMLEKRMNVLLMGVDSNGRGTQRFNCTRSDTMILLSMDPALKKVGMVSIPRDSRVQLAGGHGIDKINAAHALGGPKLAVETVQNNFGVVIDHYVVIDTQGLKKVFEELGPMDVVVEKRMHYNDWAGGLHVALEPGLHRLTPQQAEQYVRFRHDQRGDIGRIDRQQWFLRQLANKFKEPQVVLKLPGLFKLANEYVVTDLSGQDMANIAGFGKDIKPNQVISATVPGKATCIRGGSYWEPDYTGAEVVFNRLAGTPMNTTPMNSTDVVATVPSNSAYAATTPDAMTANAAISVIIKYPKGFEKTAKAFETALVNAGYRVKYKTRVDSGDCQHEQIIQNSYKADDLLTSKLQEGVPTLASFPIIVNLDEKALSDFTIIVTPNSIAPVTVLNKVEQPKEASHS